MKKSIACISALAAFLCLPVLALAAGNDYGINPAEGWESLWHKLLIDLWVIGIVFGLAALYMLFKYRAKGPDDVGHGPKFTKAQSWAWVLIPCSLFIADDFFLSAKGWTLWNVYRRVPDNAMEVKLMARQWQWEFDYGQGVVTNELVVPVGQPVVLRMTADDVIHSFFMPAYKVKEDVMPGRMTYLWFLPTKPGKVVATCTEFCGTAHADMYTDVIAVEPAEFMQWFASKVKHADTSPASAGNKS
jgi:cytochrome c oxidase subunit 2